MGASTKDTAPLIKRPLPELLTAHLPLLWLSLAFISGIIVAWWIRLPAWLWFLLGVLIFIAGLILRRQLALPASFPISYTLVTLSIAFLLLGAARYQLALPKITPSHIAYYNDRGYDVLVTGIIDDLPDERDTYSNLRLRVEAVDTGAGDTPAQGMLLARVSPNQTYNYGERLRLRGRLATPPENEDFSYRDYLARENILSYMSFAEASTLPGTGGNPIISLVYTLKEKALENAYRLFPDPEASLLAGILLGVDTGLSRNLQKAFQNTGTAHIIAISGFNIAIIAGVFVTLFSRWLGPRRGALAAVSAIAFYTFLVGADAAVVRAAIMGAFSLLARQIGRRNLALNTLALTGLIMASLNPLVLWDVGFQLSFFATLGLVLYAEPFSQFTLHLLTTFNFQLSLIEKIIQPITDFILLTFAAQLTTLPIMIYQFKRLSLIALIANPFILPAQPAVMILGGLAVFISLILLPLGQLTAWFAWPFVMYTIRMVELFELVPRGTVFLGNFSIWFAALFYSALLSVTFGWPRIRGWISSLRARFQNLPLITVLAALFICSLLTWRAALSAGDGRLHITFLEVGSADAILVQTPAGRNILINGGPSTSQLSDQLGRRLPIFRRDLDWLVISGTAENEVTALPRVLDRYPPKEALWSGNVQASYSSRQVDIWLADHSTPVLHAEVGERLDLGEGAYIKVLAAGARGSMLAIEWKNFRAVLPVGVDADTMTELDYGSALGPADVLLLADSGYAQSNPPNWIENLNPQLAVLSVSAGDPDGLPAQETLEALADHQLLRTDRNGWISISTDGDQMRVEVERQEFPDGVTRNR
jgi:competence protein ComEC